MNDEYPVQLSIDYGDGTRNRLTTLFRIILIIPIAIVAGFLAGTVLLFGDSNTLLLTWDWNESEGAIDQINGILFGYGAGITVGILLLILFRKKYPRWVFNFLVEVARLTTRVEAYLLLLVDEYPSTDEEQSVHLDIEYPDAENDLNRFLPLVKWLLAIPHYIALIVLGIIAVLLTIVAWFAIIITGRYPRAIFDFVVGVGRWGTRVVAYAFLLTTDRYPPFRLGA